MGYWEGIMHYVWGKAGQGEGDWHWDGRVQSVKLH